MAEKVLQVNFKFSVTPEEYAEAVAPLAEPISEIGGLLWKVWITNPEEREAGGIYLFADESSRAAYAGSEIVEGILNNPVLSQFNIKSFDVMPEPCRITRAPLGESVATA